MIFGSLSEGFLAIARDGSLYAWGGNGSGQLGNEAEGYSSVPGPVRGIAQVESVAGGYFHSVATRVDGSVWSWGYNVDGELGDGTLVPRISPVVVLRRDGGGSVATNDWFLDLRPAVATTIPADRIPVFLVVATPDGGDVTARIRYRAQDLGTTGSVYVFALAPANAVKASADGSPPVAPCRLATRSPLSASPTCFPPLRTRTTSGR